MDGERGRRGGYVSFLLRLWRVSLAGRWAWRASLQRPGETSRRLFANLNDMVAFLWADTQERDEEEVTDTEVPMDPSGCRYLVAGRRAVCPHAHDQAGDGHGLLPLGIERQRGLAVVREGLAKDGYLYAPDENEVPACVSWNN